LPWACLCPAAGTLLVRRKTKLIHHGLPRGRSIADGMGEPAVLPWYTRATPMLAALTVRRRKWKP